MSKLNWSKARARYRMQHYGYQPALGGDSFFVTRLLGRLSVPSANAGANLQPKNHQPTKAELAHQAAAAFMAWRARRAGRL
jgi:hypothetical protein